MNPDGAVSAMVSSLGSLPSLEDLSPHGYPPTSALPLREVLAVATRAAYDYMLGVRYSLFFWWRWYECCLLPAAGVLRRAE